MDDWLDDIDLWEEMGRMFRIDIEGKWFHGEERGGGGGKNEGGIFGTRRPFQWTLTNFYERPTCQMEGKKSKV